MKIKYTENPLQIKIELNETEQQLLKTRLLVEELEWKMLDIADGDATYVEAMDSAYSEADRVFPYYLAALESEIHCGDCTSVPMSCTKCFAEGLLNLNHMEDIGGWYYIDKVFKQDGVTTCQQAIEWLENNPVKPTWEGSEPYVPRWQKEQDAALESLKKYQKEKLLPS